MNRSLLSILAGALCGAVLVFGVASWPADANRPPLDAFSVPAVGPGFTTSWAKTCTTTASTIVPAGTSVVAFECSAVESTETDATQLVAIGPSTIADPATATRNSPVLCGSGCSATSKSINARQAYCRSDTDDTLIYCWGITTTATQP